MTENKKAQIKEAIRQLHAGVPPEQVKETFRAVLETADPVEIAKIEEELVKEGMEKTQLRKLCDVHMAIFKEQLEKQMPPVAPNQPISILMEEHKIMLKLAEELSALAKRINKITDMRYATEEIHRVQHIAEDFTDSEKHFQREENALFPIIEKHGVTEPPAVMWMEHTDIKEQKKKLHALVTELEKTGFQNYKQQLAETAQLLGNLLQSHFFKENSILFPTALNLVTEQEWTEVRKEFDEIGYCCFTPPALTAQAPKAAAEQAKAKTPEGLLQLETGSFTKDQLEAVLNTLPVDITFVDADDTVQYFNKPDQRLFIRAKAVLGRKVALCHPAKSLATVSRIVESFKNGKKNTAEFWITLNGRFVHIRFFAVRDSNGKYLGAIEVVQDLTDIKKLEGERRLLDWKD
ncbi:MAG: DUF438 domain-containing protein [Candidatus Bathyarchaeia archaeon]